MDFLHFFAYLLFPEWVFRLFYSVPSTTQTHEADSNLLPDVTSGSPLSSETNTEKVSEPIGSQYYQTESNDSVLEEEIKTLREELRLMTLSRDSLLVKSRQMKFHAFARITTISQLKSKIVLLESEIQALTHSLVHLENQTPLTSEKDSNNLSSAHADQQPSIPDIQSQEDPMKVSISKTYDREFLLRQRTSFLSQKKPDGIFPVPEIVRETVAPKRNVVSLSSIETIGAQVTEAPRRELKLTPVIIKERAASNEWRPASVKHSIAGGEEMTTAVVLKTVRGLLNKMTPSKHDKLFAQIENLPIDTEERLAGVIQLFFEKAISEPFFAPTYAKMCQSLSQKAVLSSSTDGEKTVSFRNLLLAQCKKEFDRDGADLIGFDEKKTEIHSAKTEENKTKLKMELQDLVDKNRRRVLGNITFIGELFRVGTISEEVIHRCIRRLITNPGEQEMEKLCVLMTTIGKDLDSSSNQNSSDMMNSHFRTLESMAVDLKLSNRLRFMITDLTELRVRQWKSREESKLEGKNPSHIKTRVTGSQHVNTTETTPVVEISSEAVDENTPVFAYSDYRLKNQLVTGYSVIPTGSANRKLEVISDPIPAQKSIIVEHISKPILQENNVPNRNYDFVVVASSVRVVELKNEIILKNIAPDNCGRVIGREGTNLKRLFEEYGTAVNWKNTRDGYCDFTFSGSTTESRREAVDDVIENLPVIIEFEHSKIDNLQRYRIKQIAHSNFVRVNMPELPDEKVTIAGKFKNCENAFKQLVKSSAK
jgi:translation initiation factor 4G